MDKIEYKIIVFFILKLFFYASLFSQNIVTNGSFEETTKEKKMKGVLKEIPSWTSPNKGTPDIFSLECRNYLGINKNYPQNTFGEQLPCDSSNYAGFIAFDEYSFEYITNDLKETLIKDNIYCFSMCISLAEIGQNASNCINILFTKEKPKGKKFKKLSSDECLSNQYIIDNYREWITLSFIYKAKGGERYLTIGCFERIDKIKNIKIKKDHKVRNLKRVPRLYTYYYIDNVSLIEIQDSSECPCYTKPLLAVNDSVTDLVMEEKDSVGHFILENIYFETDKAILLDSSYKELDAMFEILSTNNSNKIIIAGHTDNQGDEKHNQQLSEARAKAVYSYFIEKGIAASRMEYIGYGSTKPISNNNTEEGRRKNRRVEILLE